MLTVADIQRAVASAYDVPISAMREPDSFGSRVREHVWSRQVAMTLSRELVPCFLSRGGQAGRISMAKIGQRFGGRDPTTVRYAVKVVERRYASDPELRNTVDSLSVGLLLREPWG